MQTDSPANAENPPATNGDPPSTTATPAPPTTRILSAQDVDESDDMEALSRILAENPEVPFENTSKPKWREGFPTSEDSPMADLSEFGTQETAAEATPGEETDAPKTGETPPEEEQEQAEAEPAAPAMPKKDASRVRINRFAENDRLVIARMAEKDGLTIDAARAELIAEGKLKAAESAPTPARSESPQPEAAPPTTADIAAKQAEIADLEAKIGEAAEAYDSKLQAKLTIEHNRALAALNRLETKAEQRAEAAQAEGFTKQQNAVAQAEVDAVGMFPDAGVKGSALYEAIADLMADAPASAFTDPDFPLTFAAKAARQIGYRPPARAEAKAPPVVVPKRPARQVVTPASGASAQATAAKAAPLNIEQEIEAAGDDPGKLDALMRRLNAPRAAA